MKIAMRNKRLRQMRREILKRIKDEYKNYKGLLAKEPKSLTNISWLFIIAAIFTLVFEVLGTKLASKKLICLFFISFMICIFLLIVWQYLEKKNRLFRESKNKDIRYICESVIEEEAKKYGVSKEELTMYMMKYYDGPKWYSFIATLLPILATAYAVHELPGYDPSEGIVIFIVLVIANYVISISSNWLLKTFSDSDSFDFYIINPYKEKFEKIEKELLK